jgi:hypothetical protein
MFLTFLKKKKKTYISFNSRCGPLNLSINPKNCEKNDINAEKK